MTDTGSGIQRDGAGRLRHLLTLDGLCAEELTQLMDLSDNDLLDLLLARKEPTGELANPQVELVLGQLRTPK